MDGFTRASYLDSLVWIMIIIIIMAIPTLVGVVVGTSIFGEKYEPMTYGLIGVGIYFLYKVYRYKQLQRKIEKRYTSKKYK